MSSLNIDNTPLSHHELTILLGNYKLFHETEAGCTNKHRRINPNAYTRGQESPPVTDRSTMHRAQGWGESGEETVDCFQKMAEEEEVVVQEGKCGRERTSSYQARIKKGEKTVATYSSLSTYAQSQKSQLHVGWKREKVSDAPSLRPLMACASTFPGPLRSIE